MNNIHTIKLLIIAFESNSILIYLIQMTYIEFLECITFFNILNPPYYWHKLKAIAIRFYINTLN